MDMNKEIESRIEKITSDEKRNIIPHMKKSDYIIAAVIIAVSLFLIVGGFFL